MMTRARVMGHLLLWCGFFAGAYLAVAQVEHVADKWSTINWPMYLLALAVGVTGVVLLARPSGSRRHTPTNWMPISKYWT